MQFVNVLKVKFIILLLVSIVQLGAENLKIRSFSGNVSILLNNKSIKLSEGQEISDLSTIKVGQSSFLELESTLGTIKIFENQDVNLINYLDHHFLNSNHLDFHTFRKEQENLKNQSFLAFEIYKLIHPPLEDYDNWKTLINQSLLKLNLTIPEQKRVSEVIILNDPTFSAISFPHGSIAITSGALDTIKGYSNQKKSEVNEEDLLAAILAHEISHYLKNHSYKKFKKLIGVPDIEEMKDAIKDFEMKKYSQELENEADFAGYFLLKKSGYNPLSMVSLLKILNEISKKTQKNAISYFSTHPSSIKRLASLPSDDQEIYKNLSIIENAFNDIQLGINLDLSLLLLEELSEEFNNDIDIRKTIAVGYHKKWLATIPSEKRLLHEYLISPSFIQSKLNPDYDLGRDKGNSIPGDIDIYYNAMSEYESILLKMNHKDPEILSNFSTLLSYDPKEKTKSLLIARKLINSHNSPQTLNNFGFVLWNTGYKDESLKVFQQLSSRVDESLGKGFKNESFQVENDLVSAEEIKLRSIYSPEYVYEYYLPLLNYILLLNDSKNPQIQKYLDYYINHCETDSFTIKGILKNYPEMKVSQPTNHKFTILDGLSIHSKFHSKFHSKLKKDSNFKNDIIEIKKETSSWIEIKSIGLKIISTDGLISKIHLNSPMSPKVNGKIAVGDDINVLKNLKYSSKNKGVIVYKGEQTMTVRVVSGKIAEIIIE
ncbi:MAG: M48 family metallopeptidase [Leptospiraceae bacterium]|nr:M48 family metallopeptidase [Leptospiraceae bacterium]